MELIQKEIKTWTSFESALNNIGINQKRTKWLFRGQPSSKNSLEPSILRIFKNEHFGPVLSADIYNVIENISTKVFVSKAHPFLSDYLCSQCKCNLDWWGIMQHHGSPTRLLDWSYSPYVALYFSCINDFESDGAVWLFNKYSVNKKIRELTKKEEIEETIKVSDSCEKLIDPSMFHCIDRNFLTDRMIPQQGAFTVCTNIVKDHKQALNEVQPKFGKENKYYCLIIKKEIKLKFLEKLQLMNIASSSLFPGIDGLGKSIDEHIKLSLFDIENQLKRKYKSKIKGVENKVSSKHKEPYN